MNMLSIIHLSLSWLLIIAVMLPFVRNDYWVFRILEYPRYQKFILCCLVLTGFIFLNRFTDTFSLVTFIIISLSVIYLAYKISPYTPLARSEMKRIKEVDKKNQVKLFSANVYQENTKYQKMITQIRECDPDIIMLLETDTLWEHETDILIKDYPHCLKVPLSNTYGILFYSRFQITEGAIKYIVDKEVPSIEATIKLPSGQPVKLWGLHPKPPVPGEDDRSTAKDKEIMKLAFKAKDQSLPVIVMGDLNDVAWSYVTELFRKTSGLLDPRRGRGFYSTFSANNWFMRFPLDYVFCSAHFGLIRMKKLGHNGSDHFAMFSHFEFQPRLKNIQEKPTADAEEISEAKKKAEQPE
jgi:endonuclease/exonuclease/phosphatase (EEP) superfamily protein YafD